MKMLFQLVPEPDRNHPGTDHIDPFGCLAGQVNYPAFRIRSPVIDPDLYGLPVFQVGNPDLCPQRNRQAGRRTLMLAELLAAGGPSSLEFIGIIGGISPFGHDPCTGGRQHH